MKWIFKLPLIFLLILTSPLVNSRDIILIENQASAEEGKLLTKILVNKFHLPLELITQKNTNKACEFRSEAIIHFCLLPDGELKVVKMNQYIVKNSLSVFLNQKDEELNENL